MVTEWISTYYAEHGHSQDTTHAILRDFEEAMSDQAVNIDISIEADDNQYDN
tara:strand:- start:892 stop:1047 length:156 start_codon:yes stop_codon:yes gene_type:complete